MHAFIEGFVPSADQVIMRGNPQGDHRNEDGENTGDHADCKYVRQQCPCEAWQRGRHQEHEHHQAHAAQQAIQGKIHPCISALAKKLFGGGNIRRNVHGCA